MSSDYTQIQIPNFIFGNSQDIHTQLVNNLITDTTDPVNSNFLLLNSTSQTTNTNFLHNGNHTHNGTLSINNTTDDTDNTNIRLAKKGWIQNYYQTLNHTWSGNDTFNQATINNLYSPIYANFQSGSELHLNTPIITPDGNGGTNTLGTTKLNYLLNVTSDIQNQINAKQNTINNGDLSISNTNGLQSALNAKQNTLTNGSISDSLLSSTFIKPSTSPILTGTNFSGIPESAITNLISDLASKQNTLTNGSIGDSLLASTFIKPSTAPILTGTNFSGIPESAITNLVSDLASKQNSITSSTDLTLHNINCNQITCNGGEIDYSSFSVAGTLTINGNVSANSQTVTPSQIGYLSSTTSDIQTQINSKQNTLTNGSISDSLLSSTFIKPSTSPILTGTNFVGIPESAITNLVSDLASKQNTLTNGSIGDSLLASTFIKPSTAPILDGSNFSNISESSINNLASDLASKQNTLTNGSITDNLLSSTFIKPSTAPILTGTNFVGIPESAITNLISDLASKQNTLTNGSIGDSLLASTFIKPSTAPILDGSNFSNISESSINNLVSDLASKQNSLTSSSDVTLHNIVCNSITCNGGETDNSSLYVAGLLTLAGNVSSNSQTITPAQVGYLSSTTSDIQTQINSKQSTLTSSSNIATNNITASGLITANNGLTVTGTLTLPSASIPTSAIASGSLTVGTLVCSSENDTGLGLFDAISEKFQSITSGTNAFTLNYSSGTVFYLGTGTTLSSNFSIQLNNCSTTTTQSQVFTLIYNTTGKYYCNSITAYTDAGTTQITLSSSTPLYSNGTPSISTSTVIVATFSLLRMFASNFVLSSVASYY